MGFGCLPWIPEWNILSTERYTARRHLTREVELVLVPVAHSQSITEYLRITYALYIIFTNYTHNSLASLKNVKFFVLELFCNFSKSNIIKIDQLNKWFAKWSTLTPRGSGQHSLGSHQRKNVGVHKIKMGVHGSRLQYTLIFVYPFYTIYHKKSHHIQYL